MAGESSSCGGVSDRSAGPQPSGSGTSESSISSYFSSSSSGGRCEVIEISIPAFGAQCGESWHSPVWRIYTYFSMFAAFSGAWPSRCKCCEYRQYIKGYFERSWSPTGPWNLVQKELTPGNYLNKLFYQEDGDGVNPYGHRSGTNQVDDMYTPLPRTTGCTYNGNDIPGMSVFPGEYYRFELHFRGLIIDFCDLHAPPIEKTWTVSCNGQAKPAPPP